MGGVQASSRISPNVNVGPDCYANDILADASVILTDALDRGHRTVRRLRPHAGRGRAAAASGRDDRVHARTVRQPPEHALQTSRRAGQRRDLRTSERGSGRSPAAPASEPSWQNRRRRRDDRRAGERSAPAPQPAGADVASAWCVRRSWSRGRRRRVPGVADLRLPARRRRQPAARRRRRHRSSASAACSSLFWAMNRVVDWLPERFRERRAAVRVRRPRPRDPRRVPHLSGDQHDPAQLQGRALARASSGSTTTSSCSPTRACSASLRNTACWIIARAARRGQRRARVRHPGRPAAAAARRSPSRSSSCRWRSRSSVRPSRSASSTATGPQGSARTSAC